MLVVVAAAAQASDVGNVVVAEDGHDGKVNEDGMEVLVAEVVVAGAVVQEVTQIELLILRYEDKRRKNHLGHPCFDFLSNLYLHDDDELLPPTVAGYHAKALFVMQRCLTCVQLGCAA